MSTDFSQKKIQFLNFLDTLSFYAVDTNLLQTAKFVQMYLFSIY